METKIQKPSKTLRLLPKKQEVKTNVKSEVATTVDGNTDIFKTSEFQSMLKETQVYVNSVYERSNFYHK